MGLPLHTAPAPVHCHDTLPQFQHWRLSRLRPPRAVAAFPTPPALAHAFTPLRRQGAAGHTLYGSLRLPTLLNWLNPSPPSCCLASRCWTYDCGRSAVHRSRADPGYWDTAGYCRILRDTAGYWPSLMRILGYSAGLEDQVAPSIAVLLLGI